MYFSNLQISKKKIFQNTILNLKFKFIANNSKVLLAWNLNFKLRIVFWNIYSESLIHTWNSDINPTQPIPKFWFGSGYYPRVPEFWVPNPRHNTNRGVYQNSNLQLFHFFAILPPFFVAMKVPKQITSLSCRKHQRGQK